MPMSAATSPSDGRANPNGRRDTRLQAIRAVGGLSIASRADGDITAVDNLHEYGGYRVKFPAVRAGVLEAVMINTGGGVAGGDRIAITAAAGESSRMSVTTATAERLYRSNGPPTTIDVTLRAGPRATLAWLPQSTILFAGSVLHRRLDADIAEDARLVVAETSVFGRTASSEAMTSGVFADQWRLYRGGRLVFAEATRLEGDVAATLARPAVANGKPIHSLLVCVAPNVEGRRDAVRDALTGSNVLTGVSAWNGILVARLAGSRLDEVANALRAATHALTLLPLPAAWTH